ncbi:synemin [Pogona vitticeps]
MERADWNEQRELRELNSRLWLYVSQVRALEEENRRLAHELAALRGREERGGPRLPEQEAEVAELRRAVAELRRAKGEAELERDALRREVAHLEQLGAQAAEERRRRRLEPQLAEQRRQLERLRADCAALEALLEHLCGERERLQAERRRPRRGPPSLARPVPAGTVRVVSRSDLEEPYALVLSWSCEQSLERYEAELRALQELEGRLGREELPPLRARNAQSRRQLEALLGRCRELSALAERLEQERLAQQERHGAALAEYQMIIDSLEEEKHFLTASIAEYLKDYHELLQVKAGLSLEIATYRALLEGESSEWILVWDEEHGRKLPQSVRNMLYEYSCRHSAYQQEKGKRTFPAIQYVDTQYKSPRTKMSSSEVYLSQTKTGRMQTASPGKTLSRDTFQTRYHPSSAIKKDASHVRTFTEQKGTRPFVSPYVVSQKSEAQWGTVPERSKREAGTTVLFSKESATVQKETSPRISENVRKGDLSTFSSYNLRSTSDQTKDERPTGRTHTANEKMSDEEVVKKETSALLERRRTKEGLADERRPSETEKVSEKSAPVGRNANVEQRSEIKQGLQEKKHTVEEPSIVEKRKDDKFIEHKTPQGGNYIRWEERIRMDVSEKSLPADTKVEESHSFQNKNVSVTTQSKETAEIHSDIHNRESTMKSKNIEITLEDVKSTVGNQKRESAFKPTGESNQDEVGEEASSKMGTFVTESIAENIVSDILKDFVPKSSDPRLPSATFEKKDVSEGEKVNTETNVQDTVQDDPNASDYFDLVGFLKRDAKKVLEDHKGTRQKDVTGDVVDAKVEGKLRRTVQVEIVEEPLGPTADEKVEFSTPFEVEEAEDTLSGVAQHPDYCDEGEATTSTAKGLKEKQPSVVVSHVEELAEGDDEVDEGKYYVSTPDEHPLGHEQDKNSVYGQIHIEEESTVKYSWQDEFLQGSQTRINESLGSPELVYQVMGGESGAYISKEEAPKEQVARAETIVIEKEIKIPHEFQDSIKGLLSRESKDPKHQLKEALEKLEDTLPESVKQELSVLTKESEADSSNVEVDIRKVERTKERGLVTLVAEVNLSQTLDSDQFDMEFLGEGVADAMKFPTESFGNEGLEEHGKQEPEGHDDGRNKVRVDVSSTPWTIEEFSSSAKLSGPDGTEHLSSEQRIYQSPVFKSTEASSGGDEQLPQMSFDINRRIKQIVIAPTEVHRTEHVFYEGPVAGGSQFGGEDFATGTSADVSQSFKEFRHGPEEIQTTETIIFRGPVHKTVEVSSSESPTQTQFSTDIKSSERISRGSAQIVEEVVFEGSTSDLPSRNSSEAVFQVKGLAETSRSVRHIRIDPKEVHSEHIVYEGRFPGVVELSTSGDHVVAEESVRHIRIGQQETRMSEQTMSKESPTETNEPSIKDGVLDTSTTIRHIKLSPKEFVTEQIVFTGPALERHLEFGGPRQDSPTGSVRHIKLGQAEVQSGEHVVYHGSAPESSGIRSPGEEVLEEGSPIEMSRTTQHIRLSSSEKPAKQIVFHGPVSETVRVSTAEPSPTDGPSESSKPVGHIKIGAKETSFTFQMDVTNVAGGGQEATVFIPGKKEAEADSSDRSTKDGQKENENDQASEELTFHQSVQLQRMVDQRSVISDEKKIALLYLNEDEGEEDDDGPWF